MGCWGMGMAQTDEFCEIYDHFMEEYDEGKPVTEITAGILAKHHAEFDDSDGIMHDVYFALAKAEWMCGEQSEQILARVKDIIETKANIEFYRELEATESDLKIRQRNLEKFWNMLQVPREKARKRKRTAPPAEKAFPPLEVGDCFAYKYEDGFRVICILERLRPRPASAETVSVALFCGVYSAEQLKKTDFLQENVGTIFTVTAAEFLGKSVIKKVAHIQIPSTARSFFRLLYESKQVFRTEIADSLGLRLRELFYHFEENTDKAIQGLEIGGCYAYPYQNGYRFAVILDQTEVENRAHFLIAVLSGSHEQTDVVLTNTAISSLMAYDKETIPNIADWKKIGNVEVPSRMQRKLFGKSRVLVGEILDFLQDRSAYHNECWTFRRLAPILEVCKDNSDETFQRLETYGLYSYRDGNESRLALILDRFRSPCGEELMLVLLLFYVPMLCSPGNYMDYAVSHVGIYSKDTLPNAEGWILKNRLLPNETLRKNIKAYTARCGMITVESHQRFFAPPSFTSTLKLERFLTSFFAEK